MEDQKIVELYFERNEDAIRETARKYDAYCTSIAMNILNSPPDAEECVSDTYLRTWNSIPPQNPPSLKNYLAKIVRRLSIDRYRKNRTVKQYIDFEISLHELSECLPAEEEHHSEVISLMEAFLREEDALSRKLFMGRYWHAVSVNDLAKHYALTPNAVTKRLIRTREKLRVYLTERGYRI